MTSISRTWKFGIAAGFIAVLIFLWKPLDQLIYSVRLASAIREMAWDGERQYPDILEKKISRREGDRVYWALTYQTAKSAPKMALVLVPGISELGCYHPRLMALSRYFASKGLLVVTPDIEEFRNFQISAKPIDQMLVWYKEAEVLYGGEKPRKTGLAGVSFSGTLALIAAADPEIRERVAFVASVGAYCNLTRCTKQWLSAIADNRTQYYPNAFYARWIIMIAALDMLPEVQDRIRLKDTLMNLLLQNKSPKSPPSLTPEGEQWYKLATSKDIPPDSELAGAIEKYLMMRLYRQLDPEDALRELHCPVFLVHGAYDDLIPPEESMKLHERIAGSHLLVSPFLTHTHASDRKLSWKEKTAAALDAVLFFYHFSRFIR